MSDTLLAGNRRPHKAAQKTFVCVFLDGGERQTVIVPAPDASDAARRAMAQIAAPCSRIDFEDDDGRLHVGRSSPWASSRGRLSVLSLSGSAFGR